MSEAAILFFPEFSSPYAYIAANLIERTAEKHGRTVRWLPVSLFHVWRAQGIARGEVAKPKEDYLRADWIRFAGMEGLPIVAKPKTWPIDAKLPRQLFYRLARQDERLAKRFALGVFHRYWGEGENVTDAADLRGLCEGLRIKSSELDAAQDDAEAKREIVAAGELAVKYGMFGTPFFVVDGETFWGADRVAHIDRFLSGRTAGVAAE